MCESLTRQQLSRRITALGIISVVFAASIAMAGDLSDVVSAADRADRLGALGILAFGFILVTGALLCLIRLQYGRMLSVLDKSAEASTLQIAAAKQTVEAMGRMIDTMKGCEFSRDPKHGG